MKNESDNPSKRRVPRVVTAVYVPYFYYLRNAVSEKVFTVCLMARMSDTLEISRGVAVCSKLDQFNKKVGRSVAQGRARKAFVSMGVTRAILREEAVELSNECKATFMFKSAYNVNLPANNTEAKILEAIRKKWNDTETLA